MSMDLRTGAPEEDPLFYGGCIHEAGHTVAARAFGFPVAWVSIDPDFTAKDPLAIENDCAGYVVSMVQASSRLAPALERGFTASTDERETLRGYCIEIAAGPISEERLNPYFDPVVGERDFGQIGQTIARLEKDNFKRRRKFAEAVDASHAFVDQNWSRIYSFAVELYSRKTLLRDEIDQVLSAPTLQSVPPMRASRTIWKMDWRAPDAKDRQKVIRRSMGDPGRFRA